MTWNVPDPRGVHNTFFALHPYSSLHELQTFFTFPPDQSIAEVVSSKKSYDSPDKFVGGSPYEKIFQDQDTIIALYNIPPGTRFPHINGFFSKDLAEIREDASGWIFARAGDAFIACRPLQPYAWKPIDGGRKVREGNGEGFGKRHDPLRRASPSASRRARSGRREVGEQLCDPL